MSRATQNLVLLLVGVSTGVMVVKGSYLHYVKPALLPWLIVAAVVLVVLAVTAIVRDLRGLARHEQSEQHDAKQHGHRHHHGLAWLLLIPIALTAFIVPPPLGAHGAAPEITAASQPVRRAFPPLPPGDAPVVPLPEVLMRAATDSTNSLAGRLITITGFTIKADGTTDLGRVVIVCCAADAQLARIHLTGAAAATVADHPEDTWLRVRGRVDPSTSTPSTKFIPTMSVAAVEQIDKPANTYSY